MERYLIVGAGIAGLYAAYFLSQRGKKVTIIDTAPQVGGLFKTVSNDAGDQFDCGSHFLEETGIEEIDGPLFKSLPDSWQRLPYMKTGTFFNGQYYDNSPFINAHHLPPHEYNIGLRELLELPEYAGKYDSCYDYLTKRFGPTFRDKLFREPLEKICGEKIENLSPLVSDNFDLYRVIVESPEKTRDLKKIPWNDDRIAFHFGYEHPSRSNFYYPRTGGIGRFVEDLAKRLRGADVKIWLNDEIAALNYDEGIITRYSTKRGLTDSIDHIIWTAPLPILGRQLGIRHDITKVRVMSSVLIDFVVDRPFLTDVYYNVCFSQKYKTFRTTYYSNMNSASTAQGRYRCCAEVIVDPLDVDSIDKRDIFSELTDMGFIDKRGKLIYARKRHEAAGFPVATKVFTVEMAKFRLLLQENVKNLLLMGKAGGATFFAPDTLVDVHRTLKTYIRDSA